jgi:hypothetical protein
LIPTGQLFVVPGDEPGSHKCETRFAFGPWAVKAKEDGLAEIANLAVDFDFHIEFSFRGFVALEAECLLSLDKNGNVQMTSIGLSARF